MLYVLVALSYSWAKELRTELQKANLMPEERYFWQPKDGNALDKLMVKHREYHNTPGHSLLVAHVVHLRQLAGNPSTRQSMEVQPPTPAVLHYMRRWCSSLLQQAVMFACLLLLLVSSCCPALPPELRKHVLIISYDLLKKRFPLELQERYGVIICDECHTLKKNSGRTQFVAPLVKRAPRALLLSGTPVTSRPIEAYYQVCGWEWECECECGWLEEWGGKNLFTIMTECWSCWGGHEHMLLACKHQPQVVCGCHARR